MFKGNNKYFWIFGVMFVLLVVIQYILPKPMNWQRTYESKDKNPFGTNAIFQLLKPTYGNKLSINKGTLYNLPESDIQQKKCLVLINGSVNLSKTDLKTLFNFMEQGNTLFIAADEFRGLDTFHIRTRPRSYQYFSNIDSLINKPGVHVKMLSKDRPKVYKYPNLCLDSYFANYDSTKFSSCSVNQDSDAVMIRASIGKGQLVLMSMPDVFTNYFIVEHANRVYAYSVLSYVTAKTKDLIWDEYYKTYNVQSDSFLRLILDSDPLYAAYLLLLITLIIYMISDGRRRQRAIPVLEPVTNTTLEFVNVVSHVYFNAENHKYIADERVKYFYETIRSRFTIQTNDINESFIETISELSGYDIKLVQQLFKYCERLRKLEEATEFDLIELNRQITNFNTKSLR